MIDREDMLLLTRRMTGKRSSITRIAGGYLEKEGEINGTFNTSFLKLSPSDKEKNLAIAKRIPFAKTNREIRRYRFGKEGQEMMHLLMELRNCGLKNDALLETFYEIAAEHYRAGGDYAVLVFHDRYDIPSKGKDKERLGESEETFEYLIGAICPLIGDYEPGMPECGFLYPAFQGGGALPEFVDIFQTEGRQTGILDILGIMKED